MKKYILLILSLIVTSSYAQDNCKNFRTGKFQNIENNIVKAEIERNDSIQTEKYGEIEIKLKIAWTDECNYRLTFIEGNEAFWNSRPKNKPTPDLIVRITKTEENWYLQESKFDIEGDFIYKSKIFKLE